MPVVDTPKALLIIDMQNGLYHHSEKPYQREQLLQNINALIAKARQAKAGIFAVRQTGPEGSPIAKGSQTWQLISELSLHPETDKVFDKYSPSAFHGTELNRWLKEKGVEELVIAGMKTQYCIDTNCRMASSLGYRTILAADAHSCMDTPDLSAQQIIAHHNATLAGPFVKLQSSNDIHF